MRVCGSTTVVVHQIANSNHLERRVTATLFTVVTSTCFSPTQLPWIPAFDCTDNFFELAAWNILAEIVLHFDQLINQIALVGELFQD